MAKVTCDVCGGLGLSCVAGSHVGERCTSCDGEGKYEDGHFEPTETSCMVAFLAALVLVLAGFLQLLIWAKPVFTWLAALGWYNVPVVAAAVLVLCIAVEFARWALTLKARRLAVVKRKINQA